MSDLLNEAKAHLRQLAPHVTARKSTALMKRLVAEVERLKAALLEAAELSEHADRTLIFNHCHQAAEAGGDDETKL